MPTVYLPRTATNRKTPVRGRTLAQFLTAESLDGKLDEVALYNWATKDPAEINRALVELVGCSDMKPNPLDSVLDPMLGAKKVIHVPVAWKPDNPLPLEKTHTVKVKKHLPVPAIAITKMTSWFVPKTGSCDIEYTLEGVSVRADKVDFEVHATGYHKIGKGDALVPCDTDTDAGSTHVFRTPSKLTIGDPVGQRRPPVAPKITWDGESVAKEGVLKPETGKKAYVSHACAPYTVNLRYYKADADKKAKITLKPFMPRWKPPPNQATVDDASLVVEWEVKDDNGKLKAGQLLLFDKAGTVVFRAALDEGKLRGGRYDLVGDTVKWPKVGIRPADMPYRAQIQAHSDENEEEGLAIAAMPTVVRAFQYAKVQFVAFNIKPGTKVTGTGSKQKIEYLGDPSDDNDLTRRCDIMKEAIREAAKTADTHDDTLKIFMAPEFYFRGKDGAYALEKLSTIPKLMRQETDKVEYVDWLFVLGTAIGYLDHEQLKKNQKGTGKSNRYEGEDKHNIVIDNVTNTPKKIEVTSPLATPEIGWKVLQGKNTRAISAVDPGVGQHKYILTLDKLSGLAVAPAYLLEPVAIVTGRKTEGGVKKIKVRSKICSRIPATVDRGRKAVRWLADQGWFTQSSITECVHEADDEYWLSLSNKKSFDLNKPVTLIEPVATEVFNVSQVQRGWPSPGLHYGLTSAVVDKESVSAIDYLGKNSSNIRDWFADDGIGRVIDIHGVKNRTVLPTEGSGALLGASPNVIEKNVAPDTWVDKSGTTHNIGSEVNLVGYGGGSVVTMDGITFGIEVCLDHMNNRLFDYYEPGVAQAGDPKVQVLLIPSWGMSIAGGELVTAQDAAHPGLVFNVDGSRCDSAARTTDTTYWCEDHPTATSATDDPCPGIVTPYVCTTCDSIAAFKAGNCREHPTVALIKYCFCGSAKRFYGCAQCGQIVSDAAGNCVTHPLQALDEAWQCPGCKGYYTANGACPSAKHDPYVCTLCNKIVALAPGNCTTHLAQALDHYVRCRGCGSVRALANPCPCTELPYVLCGETYPDGGACSHPPSMPQAHRKRLQQIGTAIATTSGPTDVTGAGAGDLFMKKGQVLLYAVKDLPLPRVV